MSLSVEQLMQPRYMVIALYPFDCSYEIGHVLTLTYDAFYDDYVYKHDPSMRKSRLDSFPHLFRLMLWYEGRKVEEMPEYVKNENGGWFKIEDYDFDANTIYIEGGYPFTLTSFLYLKTPSTATEYLTYKNKKDE